MPDFTREEIEEVVNTSRKLQRANLVGIDLREADLSYADLRWANLSRANLHRAYLRGANLSRANLFEADLSFAVLSGARYSSDTKFPEGFDPEAAGMVLDNSS